MKGKKIIIISIIFNILCISVIYNFIKKDYVNNKRMIVKAMSETEYEDYITTINESHTEYANYIQTAKQKIANAINEYPNNNVSEQNSLEDFSTIISNLTNIPENTYYYEKGTEGNESTIVRYKKVADQYYKCDEHGKVASGTTATDVSSLTLTPYTSMTSTKLSSGFAGYSSGNLYLGDGSDYRDKFISDSIIGNSLYTNGSVGAGSSSHSYTFKENHNVVLLFCSYGHRGGGTSTPSITTNGNSSISLVLSKGYTSSNTDQVSVNLYVYKILQPKANETITCNSEWTDGRVISFLEIF